MGLGLTLGCEQRRGCQMIIKSRHTISNQDGATMVPRLKQLVLEVHLRDTLERGNVKQVSHGAIRGLEMADRIHHGLVLLRNPIRAIELLISNRGDSQLNNNVPADLVARNRECHPL